MFLCKKLIQLDLFNRGDVDIGRNAERHSITFYLSEGKQ